MYESFKYLQKSFYKDSMGTSLNPGPPEKTMVIHVHDGEHGGL